MSQGAREIIREPGPSRQPQLRPTIYQRATVLMILAMWALFWVPSLINAVVVGRQYAGLADNIIVSPAAALSSTALQYLSILLMGVALLDAIASRAPIELGRVLLAVVPWASIYLVDYFTSGGVPWQAWIYPPAMAVLSVANLPAHSVYKLIRNMTLFIAVLSIVLALLPGQPGMMPATFHGGNEKAIIGDSILAGPFGHSNQLGLNMALGLPFAAWTLRGFRRVAAFGLIALVLLWSASRTSIYVAVAVLVITIATLWVRRGTSRALVFVTTAGSIAAMVILPLTTDDPSAFTNRGLIWQEGLVSFSSSPLTGTASNAFMVDSDLSRRIGDIINTGHNVFVTVATIGGLIGLAGFAVGLVAMIVLGVRRYSRDVVPLLTLMSILLLSVIEDPLRALILAPTSAIVWPVMSILFRRTQAVPADSQDSIESVSLTTGERISFIVIFLAAAATLVPTIGLFGP